MDNQKYISILLGLIFLILLASCTSDSQTAEPQLDLDHLEQQWAVDIGEPIAQPPVFLKKTLIILPSESPLLAMNADTGATRWQLDTPALFWGESLSSTLDDVLLAGANGRLLALSPRSGIVEWEIDLEGDVVIQPLLDRYILFTPTHPFEEQPSTGAVVFALNASTGETLWRYKTHSANLQRPTRGGEQLYLAGNSGNSATVYALSAAKGELNWELSLEEPVQAIQALENVIIVLGTQGTLHGLDSQTGDLLWEEQSNSKRDLHGWGDRILISGKDTLETRDPLSGELIWNFQGENEIVDLFISKDTLLLLNSGCEIHNLSAKDGHELGRFPFACSDPTGMVIQGNWLYISDASGIVYAYAQTD